MLADRGLPKNYSGCCEEIINFIIKEDISSMLRKLNHRSNHPSELSDSNKTHSHSLSTQESPRQNSSQPTTYKEKSQLCKKFVENGYCPYEKKCKFAHGLHELKKNQQANSKYKTKTCGGFLQEGYCPYGNRCNFIHPPVHTSWTRLRSCPSSLLEALALGRQESRLLKLLSPQP